MLLTDEMKNALFLPTMTTAGEMLNVLFRRAFGKLFLDAEVSHSVTPGDSEDAKYIQAYNEQLQRSKDSIPDERLCEPSLFIVGSALEASKYSYREPLIRDMFVNLITASMDKERTDLVHPFFIEAIKQLSACDARNLSFFFIRRLSDDLGKCPVPHEISQSVACAIAEYQIKSGTDSIEIVQKNVFTADVMNSNISQQATSIANLVRMGLLEIDYSHKCAENEYLPMTHTKEYQEILVRCERSGATPYVKKGTVYLTPLGVDFCSICL